MTKHTVPYEPKEGSVPALVFEILKPGERMPAKDINAQLLKVPMNIMHQSLVAAIRNCVIVKHFMPDGSIDYERVPEPEPPPPEPPPRPKKQEWFPT